MAIEKSNFEKKVEAIDSEKQKLKGKISKLEDDIGKVPNHVLGKIFYKRLLRNVIKKGYLFIDMNSICNV